jgi:hypothetical protein
MSVRGKLAWGWIVALAILHYDFWYWDDPSLVFGFMPIGLLWQMGISVGAALGWYAVVRWAWPVDVEAWAGAADESRGGPE